MGDSSCVVGTGLGDSVMSKASTGRVSSEDPSVGTEPSGWLVVFSSTGTMLGAAGVVVVSLSWGSGSGSGSPPRGGFSGDPTEKEIKVH